MWFVPRFLELAWSLAVFLFLALILGGNNALIHHPSTLMDRSRQQCNSRYNIASYSSVVDHRSKSQSFSPDGSFAAAFAIAGSNEQNSEEGRSKAVSQLSLDKAEYLVVLWHSLSEIGLEMDHPHTFDSIISAGLFEHIQHCIDVDLIRNYEVYDTTSSLLMEPRAAVVVVDPDNEPIHMENVLTVTRDWVKAMIADFSICPYTIDADRAGKPIGGVRYSISDAASPEEAFRDFWAEVYGMLSSKEEDVSTVLLTYPRKVFKDEGYFEKFCESLNQALEKEAADFDDDIQLVFFHPEFKFKDKDEQVILVFDDDDNPIGLSSDMVKPIDFSRRSPWPIINILRTPQVTAVQSNVPEGKIYDTNIERLEEVGTNILQEMLDNQDWRDLPVHSTHAKQQMARGQR